MKIESGGELNKDKLQKTLDNIPYDDLGPRIERTGIRQVPPTHELLSDILYNIKEIGQERLKVLSEQDISDSQREKELSNCLEFVKQGAESELIRYLDKGGDEIAEMGMTEEQITEREALKQETKKTMREIVEREMSKEEVKKLRIEEEKARKMEEEIEKIKQEGTKLSSNQEDFLKGIIASELVIGRSSSKEKATSTFEKMFENMDFLSKAGNLTAFQELFPIIDKKRKESINTTFAPVFDKGMGKFGYWWDDEKNQYVLSNNPNLSINRSMAINY